MTDNGIVEKLRNLRIADLTIEREEASPLELTGERCFKGIRIWLEDGSSLYLSDTTRFYPASANLDQPAETGTTVQES